MKYATPVTVSFLTKSFFAYVVTLPRLRNRVLLMAQLLQRMPAARSKTKIFSTTIILFLGFTAFTALFAVLALALDALGENAYNYFVYPGLSFLLMAIFLPIVRYLGAMWSTSSRTSLLRCSYYLRAQQSLDKRKLKQMLILDGARAFKKPLAVMLAMYILTAPLLFGIFRFLAHDPDRFSHGVLSAISFYVVAFSFIAARLNIALPQFHRRFLYGMHIRKHGSVAKEIEDVVNRAWEMYPDRTIGRAGSHADKSRPSG